MSERTQRR